MIKPLRGSLVPYRVDSDQVTCTTAFITHTGDCHTFAPMLLSTVVAQGFFAFRYWVSGYWGRSKSPIQISRSLGWRLEFRWSSLDGAFLSYDNCWLRVFLIRRFLQDLGHSQCLFVSFWVKHLDHAVGLRVQPQHKFLRLLFFSVC